MFEEVAVVAPFPVMKTKRECSPGPSPAGVRSTEPASARPPPQPEPEKRRDQRKSPCLSVHRMIPLTGGACSEAAAANLAFDRPAERPAVGRAESWFSREQ